MFPHRDGEESGVRKGENLSRLEGVLFLYNNKKKKTKRFICYTFMFMMRLLKFLLFIIAYKMVTLF